MMATDPLMSSGLLKAKNKSAAGHGAGTQHVDPGFLVGFLFRDGERAAEKKLHEMERKKSSSLFHHPATCCNISDQDGPHRLHVSPPASRFQQTDGLVSKNPVKPGRTCRKPFQRRESESKRVKPSKRSAKDEQKKGDSPETIDIRSGE